MKVVASLLAALAALAPAVALACPYAAGTASSGCGACGTSLFQYGASLVLGLGLGIGSVALQHRRKG
ncbi:MAG TPA: hypothetical protein VIF15_04530 [Polyangiaceae bacterium]|jgi:hypothetical protein